jgi:hypothetical protein
LRENNYQLISSFGSSFIIRAVNLSNESDVFVIILLFHAPAYCAQ